MKQLPVFLHDVQRIPLPEQVIGWAGDNNNFYWGDTEFHLDQGMPLGLLRRHVKDGYVSTNVLSFDQPNVEDLHIFKYSDHAIYGQVWDEATLQCRGLIVSNSGHIVARGFNKFFNFEEISHLLPSNVYDSEAVLMDKMDGSLGIAFKWADQWIVATAGSFTSEQARHATRLMNEKYSNVPYEYGRTLLVEIIYPENRIVTDYGDLDDLVLIGGADLKGHWISPDEIEWPGPRVQTHWGTLGNVLKEANSADMSTDREGFVVYLPEARTMVKFKLQSYLELHRAKYGLTKREVYRQLRDGTSDEFVAALPDEFQGQVIGWINEMNHEIDQCQEAIKDAWGEIQGSLDEGADRRQIATAISSSSFSVDMKNFVVAAYLSQKQTRLSLLRKLNIYRSGAYYEQLTTRSF